MNSWSWQRGVWSTGGVWAVDLYESNWNPSARRRSTWRARTTFWFRDNPAFEMRPLNRGFGPVRIG